MHVSLEHFPTKWIPVRRRKCEQTRSWSAGRYIEIILSRRIQFKIKPVGARPSGVTIKTDGEEIAPNSPDPYAFQAALPSASLEKQNWSRYMAPRFALEPSRPFPPAS